MTIRTHKKIGTFKKPFLLEYIGRTLPAGNYEVVTEEELLEGLSFYGYRRLQTFINRQSAPDEKSLAQSYVVDPDELDDAIERGGPRQLGMLGSTAIAKQQNRRQRTAKRYRITRLWADRTMMACLAVHISTAVSGCPASTS